MDDNTRQQLEAERDFLLKSLADLDAEREAGDVDDHDFARLRDDYTRRAAQVLRALDDGGHDHDDDLDDDEFETDYRSSRRGFGVRLVAGFVVVAMLAGALGWVIALYSGTRLAGESATGDVASSVNGLLAEARGLSQTDPLDAIQAYDNALALDPTNPEALTYKGWLLVRVGVSASEPVVELIDAGRRSLDAAVEANPQYADARALRGVVAFQVDNDAAAAQEQFDALFALGSLDPMMVQLVEPVDAASREALGLQPR